MYSQQRHIYQQIDHIFGLKIFKQENLAVVCSTWWLQIKTTLYLTIQTDIMAVRPWVECPTLNGSFTKGLEGVQEK